MKNRIPASQFQEKLEPRKSPKTIAPVRLLYPFSAIVGQPALKLALILNVVDPSIGGVLMMGHRGTGKSTAVRALADLLPAAWVSRGCHYNCDPSERERLCIDCSRRLNEKGSLARDRAPVPVVDLPLGATEDRVCGSIDIEQALKDGVKAFEPGLLARANRGFLYIDEVNLLEDHLVDLLLDVAANGRNKVERENISFEHEARFVLIGSGNPEEGELRPQLLDRFGLYVQVQTENEIEQRMAIVEKREAFERNPAEFCAAESSPQDQLRQRIGRARKSFAGVKLERVLLRQIAALCSELKVDGHRGELTIMRASRALAAFSGRRAVGEQDVREVAAMCLRHRLHRDPLAETAAAAKIEDALNRIFQSAHPAAGYDNEGRRSPRNQGAPDKDSAGNSGRPRRLPAQGNPQGQNGSAADAEVAAPAADDARLGRFALEHSQDSRTARKAAARGRGTHARSSSYNSQRGRYARPVSVKSVGARIALLATLQEAILAGRDRLAVDSLRYKQFARKNGTLFIFAIDASGSMALSRINQAKGVLLQLLAQSYINRDKVAILTFKGTTAEVMLLPSRSVSRARRVLDSLTIGGGTPLSAALVCSLELARTAAIHGRGEILLLLFTDGHANVSLTTNAPADRVSRQQVIQAEMQRLGTELASQAIAVIVADTGKQFGASNNARAMAELLGARYLNIG
jgi:magnesium chelatase subunit D